MVILFIILSELVDGMFLFVNFNSTFTFIFISFRCFVIDLLISIFINFVSVHEPYCYRF